MVVSTFFFGVCLIVYAAPAYAYIDPGTGSFVIQMLIAMFVSGAFAVKTFWKQIKLFFAKHFGKSKQGKNE